MRVDEALRQAREKIDAVDARALLHHATGLTHAMQQTHPETVLSEPQRAQFFDHVARRAAGEPVAYLIGHREFYGRDFLITPDVLIPRPETEHLVDCARHAIESLTQPRVLDLGTGSGIVAITLACLMPQAVVVAVDASSAALAVARHNASRLGARVDFLQSDWYGALGDERFDLIVSNPPYIAANDHHLSEGDLCFEPPGALTDGSDDGLASLRQIIRSAPHHLAPQGWLWLEHGFDQGPACCELLEAAGFVGVHSVPDLAGHPRISGGRAGPAH